MTCGQLRKILSCVKDDMEVLILYDQGHGHLDLEEVLLLTPKFSETCRYGGHVLLSPETKTLEYINTSSDGYNAITLNPPASA